MGRPADSKVPVALWLRSSWKPSVPCSDAVVKCTVAHVALPRVSLNGDYQSLTYTALYLSGAPFALWNRFQQINAA